MLVHRIVKVNYFINNSFTILSIDKYTDPLALFLIIVNTVFFNKTDTIGSCYFFIVKVDWVRNSHEGVNEIMSFIVVVEERTAFSFWKGAFLPPTKYL